MNYQEAFKYAVNKYGEKVLNDAFLLRSLLFDLTHNSYHHLTIINAYYELNEHSSIYSRIKESSLEESKKFIKDVAIKADKKYTIEQYIRSIEPLLLLVFPDEYTPIDCIKKKKETATVVHKDRRPIYQEPLVVASYQVAKKKPTVFTSLRLMSNCYYLTIEKHSEKEIKIFDASGVDITKEFKQHHRKDTLNLDLQSRHSQLTVKLPASIKNQLDIYYTGKVLIMSGLGGPKISVNEMNLSLNDANAIISLTANRVNVKQIKGAFSMYGEIKNVSYLGNSVTTSCYLYNGIQDKCCVNVNSGKIDLNFVGHPVKPSINHIFKRIKYVNGVYEIGHKKVSLSLSVNKGRIKVK